jgi:integrase
LPATIETIVGFLVDMAATRELATLRRYRSTVSKMHKIAGVPSLAFHDQVRTVMRGIAVEKTERSRNAKAATTADVFGPMIETIPGERPKDIRDRAILLLGVVTGMRSAELTAVDIEDLTWHERGLSILIRRSKTDQTGLGRYVAVPCEHENSDDGTRCAAHAIRAWLDVSKITTGALFRSFWRNGRGLKTARFAAGDVAGIVKEAASGAGLDPKIYAAHSLRSGYVTQARREGLSYPEIMEQTGHKDLASVKRYSRDPVDPFRTGRVREVARAFARNPKIDSRGDLEEHERTGGK